MTNMTMTLRQTARALAIALMLGSAFLGFPAVASEPRAVQETFQPTAPEPVASEATQADTDSYAAREKQAGSALADFQGGDTVVIVGGTTIVIVLLVVLVLVLI